MPDDVTSTESSPESKDDTTVVTGSPTDHNASVMEERPERPLENVMGEFNRKIAKMQSQYETLMQYVVSQAQAKPSVAEKGDPTDDELWSLAQQGDRRAFDVYMQRIASRSQQVQSRQFEYQRLVENQLSVLAQRYPVLNDASHPLTQQVSLTYQALVARGYPAGVTTTLEAIKTAIADRPDLVADLQARLQPAALRRDRAQSGVTGATTRDAPSTPAAKPVSEAEAKLAQRMGIKDPAKAKDRFYQRQDKGQSSLGAVASYIKEE